MNLYDNVIKESLSLLDDFELRKLHAYCREGQRLWEDAGKSNMILRSDMAYELGGGTNAAISGMYFSFDANLLKGDELLLYGPDLPDIHRDIPYARLTFIQLENTMEADVLDKEKQRIQYYDLFKKLEYTRFHVHPKGYMSRISAANNREPVRIGKQAISDGLTFEAAGQLMINAYHSISNVKSVKLLYITEETFPYQRLEMLTKKAGQITESLNSIFNNLAMDCSVCGLKPVCDEVEGMKELHFSQIFK